MTKALKSVPGVQKVTVNFDAKEARVTFDANKATIEQMAAALKEAGYEGSLKSWPES